MAGENGGNLWGAAEGALGALSGVVSTAAGLYGAVKALAAGQSELFNEEEAATPKIYENEQWAKIEKEGQEPMGFSNGQSLAITIFFAPKFVIDPKKRFDLSEMVFLDYNERVRQLVIEDDIEHFGWAGFIEFVNKGEAYNTILDRINCYHLIINITEQLDDVRRIKYEPYVCEVMGVENLSDPEDEQQVVRLRFVDRLQGIAQSHSIASVLKMQGSLTRKTNYKDVFSSIISYLLRFVRTNLDDGVEFKKDILFSRERLDTDYQSLIEYSFKKLDPTATILEAMETLLRDCGTAIKASKGFLEKYNDIGNVIVPFFVREEYPDMVNGYMAVYGENARVGAEDPERAKQLESGSEEVDRTGEVMFKNFGREGTTLLYRPITFRDFLMPFQLAFVKDNRVIFESINPARDKDGKLTENERRFTVMNGRTDVPIDDCKFYPMEPQLAAKSWKNMVICNSGQQENSTVLITFNWIYQYYVNVFLGADGTDNDFRVSNITPDFYLVEKEGLITNSGLVSDFNEMNANFFVTRSKNDTNEALMLIGKQLTQMVLLNSSYTFTIQGSLRRHPNEIVKFSRNLARPDTNDPTNLYTDFVRNDYTLLYVTRVRHVFTGTTYYNTVDASRIYDSLANETRDTI